ncbi:MAG: 50S ribosomal protein L2 [Candidatus Ranarchaeia archaeon]|jgi:large subunit ribosomal protein L2
MGKRIGVQRRGRGSPTFRAPSHKRRGDIKHPDYDLTREETVKAEVLDLVHDPGRGAPVASIKLPSGESQYVLVSEGVAVGENLHYGPEAPILPGNVLPLEVIPDGTLVCNIEQNPGDGGRFARSSGSFGVIRTHTDDRAIIKLPSGREKHFPFSCRAMIGVVAGGGRNQRPFLKAGNRFHSLKVKAKTWPRVRGVAMNAVYHPFGGGSKQGPGRSSTSSRHAPPGAKVGLIAARRSGRGGRKK